MDQEKALKIVKDFIAFLQRQGYGVRKAYIFGSYAKGTYDADSDIDLAIILNNLENGYLTQIDLIKLNRKFDNRIEPHPIREEDFHQVAFPLVREIMQTGVPVA